MSLLNSVLEPTYLPFIDKDGKHVEVLAVLPSRLVVLYSNQDTQTIDITEQETASIKIGDKLYYDLDGKYVRTVSPVLETAATSSNKHSPANFLADSYLR